MLYVMVKKASRQRKLCCRLEMLCAITAKLHAVAVLAGAALCSAPHTVWTPLVVLLNEWLDVRRSSVIRDIYPVIVCLPLPCLDMLLSPLLLLVLLCL
jgi:hypothetical protein